MTPRTSVARRRAAGVAAAAWAVVGLAVSLSSCAYYNTFYIARKYYGRATQGQPYRVNRADTPDNTNLTKSIDYSKKLLANYPKSKWADDAYLLWAKAFLAKNDPLQTVSMLQDFNSRYPASSLKSDVVFYRAVALRQARRYPEALQAFDEFLKQSPRRELLPFAHLERARTLRSLERPADAAAAAGLVVERWPRSPLAVTARIARAEANLSLGAHEAARSDFHLLGALSRTDDERLVYLLRESECLEAARRFDEALALLRGALGHERPPLKPDTTGGRPMMIPQTAGYDRYGLLLTRVGTVQLMSGHTDQALESYRRVVDDYPRTPVGAEAQYRLGYAFEIGADDFERARSEYAKVRDQNAGSPFVAQATQRQNTLDQLARFRSASGDSADSRAQGGFLLAEQYLFQLDKPDRALAEYARVAQEHAGTPLAGKALNAQAWVLRRRLNREADAESLLWRVVREYPATEAQLAARDYLEAIGREVPAELIHLPPPPKPDTSASKTPVPGSELMRSLTPTPAGSTPLGGRAGLASNDSLVRASMAQSVFGQPLIADPARRLPFTNSFPTPDSHFPPRFAADSTARDEAMVRNGPPGLPMIPPAPDAITLAGSAPTSTPPLAAAVAAVAADTARAKAPLPPIEFSPVRPGITFPSGQPRYLGANPPPVTSGLVNAARPASPLLGATAPANTDRAGVAGAASDSSRSRAADVRGRRAEPRGFQPRGAHIQ